MRRVVAILFAGSLVAGATPLQAGKPQADDADKVVCKVQAKTNTRFPKKICHTRAEWDRISAQHQREAAEEIERPMSNPVCTGTGC